MLLLRGGGVGTRAAGGQRLPRSVQGSTERSQKKQDLATGPSLGLQGNAYLRSRQE